MIAIIGDIHGCYYTLQELYEKIIEHTDEIYSVGDLTDRGNFSREVIDFCINRQIKPVIGNHDDLLMRATGLKPPGNETLNFWIKNHFKNGGMKTYQSYIPYFTERDIYSFRSTLEYYKHDKFLLSLPMSYEFEKVHLTHAGVTKLTKDTIWHREKLSKLDKLQVVGHTPNKRYVYKQGWYINIDTGCVYGGKLSAALVDEKTGTVIEFIQQKVHRSDTELNLM